MFILKMYVQIMSLSVLLCNVCVCYVYILKMSKKIKVKKKGPVAFARSYNMICCSGHYSSILVQEPYNIGEITLYQYS